MDRLTDEQRAQELGMSLETFQALVGYDPLDQYPEFTEIKSAEPQKGDVPSVADDNSKD